MEKTEQISFDYATIDLRPENVRLDFQIIFNCPCIIEEEKIKFYNLFYKKHIHEIEKFEGMNVLFIRKRNKNIFKFYDVVYSDQIDDDFDNNIIKLCFTIGSDIFIFEKNMSKISCTKLKSDNQHNYLRCKFTLNKIDNYDINNNNTDDIDDKNVIFEGDYLKDDGASYTFIPISKYIDYSNLNFWSKIAPFDEDFDELIYKYYFVPTKTSNGVVIRLIIYLKNPFYVKVNGTLDIEVTEFISDVPSFQYDDTVVFSGRYTSCLYKMCNDDLLFGTNLIYKVFTITVPLGEEIDSRGNYILRSKMSMHNFTPIPGKKYYNTMIFNKYLPLRKIDNFYYFRNAKFNYITDKYITLISLDNNNEFNNYINSEDKICDGCCVKNGNIEKIHINDPDSFELNLKENEELILNPNFGNKSINNYMIGVGMVMHSYKNI